MKYSIIAVAAMAALATPALAFGGDSMDANHDGSVTKAEFDAGVTAGWTKMDANADGQLTAAESGGKWDKADWTAADTDGNGTLSAAEFTAKKTAWWTASDANADGTIDKAEHDAAMKKKG